MTAKYQWTDVWLLASIGISQNCDDPDGSPSYKKKVKLPPELAKLKNIYHVIAAGDYIDRSIFKVEELTSGIKKLLEGGFIAIESECIKYSKKTNEYFDEEVGEGNQISIKGALIILRKLLDVPRNT